MRKALAIGLITLGALGSTYAYANQEVREIALKDGSTLLIFKDGKMSMRDTRGRIHGMKSGARMETKDGQVIMMKGNEVWRLTDREKFLADMYRGGA